MRRSERRFLGILLVLIVVLAWSKAANAHRPRSPETADSAFEQLDIHGLRSPSAARAASGAPGPDYWQQRVDYIIDVTLDEDQRRIIGTEEITYHNNSPDTLAYLWVQLDQNRFRTNSEDVRSATLPSM